uniref:C2H2-type domain-containing protein n=1 Tax=Heterorhabditis bacteriophora TaxID=37862 RepID=A0A1I7WUM1_HETBA
MFNNNGIQIIASGTPETTHMGKSEKNGTIQSLDKANMQLGEKTINEDQWKPFSVSMTSMSDGEQEFIDCANCTLLVHRRIHVKCCECPSSFCIQCFRMGCETGAHRRGHNYEIRDPVGEPTFEGKGSWGCIEEARLLVAAHRYKLGNWGEMINMMESDRQAHQAQEYFDRCFIRGPFGQFALKGINWLVSVLILNAFNLYLILFLGLIQNVQWLLMVQSINCYVVIQIVSNECYLKKINLHTISLYVGNLQFNHGLIMDALRSTQEIFNPEDPDLDRIINDLVERYIEEFKANIRDKPTPIRQIGDKLSVEEVLSDDSNDLSDDVDGCEKNKALDDAEMTGLEPENDSDDEDVPSIPIVVLQKVKDKGKVEMKSEIRDKKALRKSLVISPAILRSSKGSRSSQRKSVQDTIKKTRYQRVQQDSSSSDDDVEGDADESDKADTEQLSLNDGDETTHGLEDSAVGCLYFYPVYFNTSIKSYKVFQLTELCPRQMISELRVSAPRLALDREKNIIERPKLRQDDLNMLAYNVDRDDFELGLHLKFVLELLAHPVLCISLKLLCLFVSFSRYLRILKARKAKRRAIIEHDKITEFFNFMMVKMYGEYYFFQF